MTEDLPKSVERLAAALKYFKIRRAGVSGSVAEGKA